MFKTAVLDIVETSQLKIFVVKWGLVFEVDLQLEYLFIFVVMAAIFEIIFEQLLVSE